MELLFLHSPKSSEFLSVTHQFHTTGLHFRDLFHEESLILQKLISKIKLPLKYSLFVHIFGSSPESLSLLYFL